MIYVISYDEEILSAVRNFKLALTVCETSNRIDCLITVFKDNGIFLKKFFYSNYLNSKLVKEKEFVIAGKHFVRK